MRVVWTEEEYDKIAAKFLELGYTLEGYGVLGRVKRAMTLALHPSRHRSLPNIEEILRKKLSNAIARVSPKKVEPLLEPPKEPEKQVTLADFTIDQMLLEINSRLSSAFSGVPIVKNPMLHTQAYEVHDKVQKKKILVIGPINGQQEQLKLHHKGLDLRFVASNENPALIKTRGQDCDAILLWTDFCSHAQQAVMKAIGGKHLLVSGGLNSLDRRLNDLEYNLL